MKASEFLEKIEAMHFSLAVENEKLILKGDKKKLTKEEIYAIKNNSEIINYIKKNKEELTQYISSSKKPNYNNRSENISAIYRLSGLQEGMLFHGLYDERVEAYVMQLECELRGLDVEAFDRSWAEVMRRHTVLRSGFYYDRFKLPVQCVYKEVRVPLEEVDYRELEEDRQQELIGAYREADRRRGFVFEEAPLMRVTLFRLGEERFWLLWSWHHILFDGWSLPVVISEVLGIYEQLVRGQGVAPAEEDRYEEYIRYLEGRDAGGDEGYWRGYLSGVVRDGKNLLPFIEATIERNKGIGQYRTEWLQLGGEASRQLEGYAQRNRITVNTVMQGVWAYVLSRYTGSREVVYGVTVSGRPEDLSGVEHRVGMYINAVPLRAEVDEEQPIGVWLRELQQDQVASREHQYTSLSEISRWLEMGGRDLFDTLVTFENYPVSKALTKGGAERRLRVGNVQSQEQSNYPLSLVIHFQEELVIQFRYNADLLNELVVRRIKGHVEQVVLGMIGREDGRWEEIGLLTEEEEREVLKEFNNTYVDYPRDKTVVELFEEQAARTPDAEAVVLEEQSLTYGELDRRSDQLGHYLRGLGVREDSLVPICVERSVEMIVGILGILKAGGAYVPIDPEYPAERIRYMLEDIGADRVVTHGAGRLALAAAGDPELIDLDDWSAIAMESAGRVSRMLRPDHLAYVIYTSGSTGRPKGVMIEHRSMTNLVRYQSEVFKINSAERIAQFSNYSFDASVEQTFLALCNGAVLVLIPRSLLIDAQAVGELLEREQVTHLHATPGFLETISMTGVAGLKRVIAGGDICGRELAKRWGGRVDFYNEYGPTEVTVTATEYRYTEKDPVEEGSLPIGQPLANTRLYVVDGRGSLCPVGIPGELWIGGVQVARGYLNLPELTAEKFIADPFGEGRLYKTGDLGRWREDGTIEFLGRRDEQVKVRGYRIELGEIEHVLGGCPGVRQSVVLAREDASGSKRLVGYVVAEGTLDKDAIEDYLQERLPEYMVPRQWVELASLPLTGNGKVDRKGLPEPDRVGLSQGYAGPRNAIEEALVAIWQELLNVERIGIHDNFFELGGHSLLAIRVISAVRKALSVEMTIGDMFDHPTIAALGERWSDVSAGVGMPTMTAGVRPERMPLSYAQERLWFIDKLEGSVQYHIPAVLRLKGKLDRDALKGALRAIVNRHEVLRTVIRERGGQGYQQLLEKGLWNMRHTDGGRFGEDNLGLQDYIEEGVAAPFDLSADHMMRAELIGVREDEHILVVVMHHIASDGWSVGVLVRELTDLYNAAIEGREATLPTLPVQYADYALWQRRYVSGEVLEGQLGYWKEKLQGASVLELPTDHERPAVQSHRGAAKTFWIDKELRDRLQGLSEREGVTLYMTLLAAFQVLLSRYSGQEDICVGSPVAGRTRQEVEGLVGFFISTVVMRCEVRGKDSFRQLLQVVKETTLGAYEHQEAPFEKVVEAVVKERDMSRSPLFQVMFTLQNTPDVPMLRLGELELSQEGTEQRTAQFDLNISVTERREGLGVSVAYCIDLFKERTIDRMAGHYDSLLRNIVVDAGQAVEALRMLTEREERQVVEEFNDTKVDYGTGKTVVDLFEEQAARTPEAVAVVFEEQSLTYGELDRRSDQLSHYLRALGVREETLVGICVQRGLEMILGILGILKAGGAYVPIDPEYPDERIEYMLEDIDSNIVVTSSKCRDRTAVGGKSRVVVELDGEQQEAIGGEETGKVSRDLKPDHLAYMIYTSGSTGRPKGVLVEHGGLVNRLLWAQDYFGLTIEDVVLQKTTYGFDVSVWELLWPLLAGAKLVFARPGGQGDSEYLRGVIESSGVTMIHFVPSMLEAFVKDIGLGDCVGLQKILCSGEALRPGMVRACQERLPQVRLYNLYGPTEATVDVSCWAVPGDRLHTGVVPIGKPVFNTQLYVVDGNGRPVPVGVPGELWIGGVQVARGYWKRPELTAEKFVANPFGEGRLYKTGDMCRWLPDGTIEYLGRRDQQVKVRGYRIELGEIESVLGGCPGIRHGVVAAGEGADGDKRLVGYVVVEGEMDKEKIEGYLGSRLPKYMIPRQWLQLERVPLMASGKVDRRKLPEPDKARTSRRYVAPRTEVECQLAGIWEELLGVERISIEDDFFESGGHSLLAARMASFISTRLKIKISIKAFFELTTIELMAQYIEADRSNYNVQKTDENSEVPLTALDHCGEKYYEITPTQLYWLDDNIDREYKQHDSVHGSVVLIYNVSGSIRTEILKRTVSWIMGRHESLRSTFHKINNTFYMKVEQPFSIADVPVSEFEIVSAAEKNATVDDIANFLDHQFDINKGPLLLVRLIRLSAEKSILAIKIHHVISDGWSLDLLMEDLILGYGAFSADQEPEVRPLTRQHKECLAMENHYTKMHFEYDKKYWESLYRDIPEEVMIPGVTRVNFDMAKKILCEENFSFSESVSERFMFLTKDLNVPLFIILQASFLFYLYHTTGKKDFLVGTYVFGREFPGAELQIGCYARTVLIRTIIHENDSFYEVVKKVIKSNADTRDRRAFTLRSALENLLPPEHYPGSAFWGINMQYFDLNMRRKKLSDEKNILKDTGVKIGLSNQSLPNSIMPIDMQLQFINLKKTIDLVVQYDGSLYDAAAINGFISPYLEFANDVAVTGNYLAAKENII